MTRWHWLFLALMVGWAQAEIRVITARVELARTESAYGKLMANAGRLAVEAERTALQLVRTKRDLQGFMAVNASTDTRMVVMP